MTGNSHAKIGGLLLAAGGSSRFGSPKQLAEFDGESLIRRATKALIEAGCEPVTVVLGAEIEHSTLQLADLRVSTTINQDWEDGMSSSIKTGLKTLEASDPDLAAVLISLCDQPLIDGQYLRRFVTTFEQTDARIIAADYGDFRGVPAIFPRARFHDLCVLTGDKGAREIIRREKSLISIPLGRDGSDIDKPEHLAALFRDASTQ